MTFREILKMINNACCDVFYTGSDGAKEAIIECATQIYIAQMKNEQNKGE